MKYYTASYSTGKETGRDFPQLHCTTQSSAHQISAWEFPDFKPELQFELNKTAKLTDVLSNAAIPGFGFLHNGRTKQILNGFNLMKNKFYDAEILLPKTGKKEKYDYLHLCDPELSRTIDYKKSVFYEEEFVFRTGKIQINSYEHYNELKLKDKEAKFSVDLDEIFVTDSFDRTLDMFVFLPFSGKIYITERLKDELEKEKITGLVFESAAEIKF